MDHAQIVLALRALIGIAKSVMDEERHRGYGRLIAEDPVLQEGLSAELARTETKPDLDFAVPT